MNPSFALVSFWMLVQLNYLNESKAAPSGSLTCGGGTSIQSAIRPHGTVGSGEIAAGGFTVSVGGEVISTNETNVFVPSQTLALTLSASGGSSFRGFMFRLSNPDGTTETGGELAVRNDDTTAQLLSLCASQNPVVSGATHTNNDDKVQVSVDLTAVGAPRRLEVTVVATKEENNWFYSSFNLDEEITPPPAMCTFCPDGSTFTNTDGSFFDPSSGNTQQCSIVSLSAGFAPNQESCIAVQKIGVAFCGCPIPPGLCTLCADGSAPPNTEREISTGSFTCADIALASLDFGESDQVCSTFRTEGVATCGCPSVVATPVPTAAPTTAAPVTAAPVTAAPVTAAPVTAAPVTAAPVTPAPVTPAPVTPAPVTAAPTTLAPVTAAPTTAAPVTPAPVTSAPITAAPTTAVPTTASPVTATPTTIAPVTAAPATAAPVTPTPVTSAPVTAAPTTSAPATATPTIAPITAAPATAAPATLAPATSAPATATPTTATPVTATPTTIAPITAAPATSAPATAAPTTSAPETAAPTTAAPATTTPTTIAPVTAAPATAAPVTPAPATSAPVTAAPTTSSPATATPTTATPVTLTPTTIAPVTAAPATAAPVTLAPATSAPVTTSPVTPLPTTAAPVTPVPTTTAPTTAAPNISAPKTPGPETAAPMIAGPSPTTPSPTISRNNNNMTSSKPIPCNICDSPYVFNEDKITKNLLDRGGNVFSPRTNCSVLRDALDSDADLCRRFKDRVMDRCCWVPCPVCPEGTVINRTKTTQNFLTSIVPDERVTCAQMERLVGFDQAACSRYREIIARRCCLPEE